MPSWFQNDTQFPSLGVYESWLLGFTGAGVHVTVLDDGVEPDHPDLVANYVSWCFARGLGLLWLTLNKNETLRSLKGMQIYYINKISNAFSTNLMDILTHFKIQKIHMHFKTLNFSILVIKL